MANGKISAKQKSEYKARSDFRYLIRTFLAFTEDAARDVDLTARQHEALLAIAASHSDLTIGDLAERLVIKHHSAVGLVDRLEKSGLIFRKENSPNRRQVVVCITPKGHNILNRLAPSHRKELSRLAPLVRTALKKLA